MNFSLLNWDNLMSESFKPVEEDLYSTIEDLADYAGEIALEIYQKKNYFRFSSHRSSKSFN